jgi:hypothetical protein
MPARAAPLAVLAFGLAAALAHAATGTSSGLGNPASADLRFSVQIDRFLFFRVGDGSWPTVNGTVNSVGFALLPSVPGGPATPVPGNKATAAWTGGAPPFAVSASGPTTLPVEVRSNGGTVSLRAVASTALTSGSNTIPMSQITVSSSDPALPAPPVPASGTGSSVTVGGTDFGGLVTVRAATWTFGFANTVVPAAGTYSGQITFTASSP